MIAELREREVRAKRKLEDTKQQLEKVLSSIILEILIALIDCR